MITQEKLKELVEYKDGQLIAKVKWADKVKVGAPLGTKNSGGYIQISIQKKRYYAHRLVFVYHYGSYPAYIDHIDGDKSNNRIENLRPASLHQNNYNIKTPKSNKSGVKNVHWNKKNNNWNVTMAANNKSMYFGSFDNLELAALVAEEARNLYHKEFACHA
jgi:hypothetical protein